MLSFVQSIRMENFRLYKESIKSLLPWFFILDHTNHFRWLSVHLVDMFQLEEINTDIATDFKNGMFVVKKNKEKVFIDWNRPCSRAKQQVPQRRWR